MVEKLNVKELGPDQPDVKISQQEKEKGKLYTRRFSQNWYTRKAWLAGCNHTNTLFCFLCLLFKTARIHRRWMWNLCLIGDSIHSLTEECSASVQQPTKKPRTFGQGEQQLGAERHISVLVDGDTSLLITKCTDGDCFQCPFCQHKGVKTIAEYHIKGHSSVKHKGFTMIKCGLNCRKATHFHCGYCTATIINRMQLLQHLEIHQEEKPHPETPGEHPEPPARHMNGFRMLYCWHDAGLMGVLTCSSPDKPLSRCPKQSERGFMGECDFAPVLSSPFRLSAEDPSVPDGFGEKWLLCYPS
nr:uncharacterized protein LOC107373205 [Nothobranchius furzeri]